MNPILLSGALIFSSLLTLLSIGLTLTYLTTKVSNFAHSAIASVGAYITLTVVEVWQGNPYHYLFVAVLVGSVLALTQYLLVFRPLIRRGASNVVLMVATLAMELVLLSVLNIYADYLTKTFKIRSRYFFLASSDITLIGQRGLLIIAPSLTVIIATLLHLLLTRTKFGIAMRAAIEDPSLASVVGINVDLVYAVSWVVAGGLGGLSGALLPLYTPGYPEMSAIIIVSVFAASIVGGLISIYGAVLGGLLMGLSEILGTSYLASFLGSWVIPYRPLIPLIAIVITLLLAPNGIMGVKGLKTESLWRRIRRKTVTAERQ
jgi:branched-chain amino acid transport system permease protein